MQFYAFYSLISSPVGPAIRICDLTSVFTFVEKPQGHNYSFCLNEMAVVIQWGQYKVYSCENARSELGEKASANQNIDLYFPNLWKSARAFPYHFILCMIAYQDGRASILGSAVEDFPSFINFLKWNGNTWKFGHCMEIELNSTSQVAILN